MGAAALILRAGSAKALVSAVTAFDHAEAVRAEAMGDAVAAVGADATLFWHNPAALDRVTNASLTVAGVRDPFGDTTGQAVWAGPFSEGVLALGLVYDDAGTETLNTSDGRSVTLRLQQDVMGALAFALPLGGGLAAGITAKGVESRLFGEVSAASLALDAGVQAKLADFLRVGAVVQNAGNSLRYAEDDAALPLAWRVGLAGGFIPGPGLILLVSGDGAASAAIGETTVGGGVELGFHRLLYLRAGARFTNRESVANYAFGLGLRKGPYRLDYGMRLARDDFQNPQALSLTFLF